ncbi:hypothetical protein [Sodalis sp. dw_96]|uniref:hypothetical protein n=1 Tax=Sodalis sp. dw_96 TaxID=2719794 RepID=UPI001BD1D7B7|nr:hypothetical protein [Sodalis sp. dw_96]
MHPVKRLLWRGIDRPWWVLTSALIAVAAVIALGASLLLRPGQKALDDVRRDIRHIENALRQHGHNMAEWPTKAQLETQISSIHRELAACETARREPAVFIKSIDPGLGGKLTWRAAPSGTDRRAAPRRWTVAANTDYPGLHRMLGRLAGLSGGLSLDSFAVGVRGGRLDIEFELADPAPVRDKEASHVK